MDIITLALAKKAISKAVEHLELQSWVGIKHIEITHDDHLVFTLSNDDIVDAGEIKDEIAREDIYELNQYLIRELAAIDDQLQNLQNKVAESASADNLTITKNSNQQLQAVGTILQSGGVQKYWRGTRSAFESIINKDSNTLYEIFDDDEVALFEVDGASIEFSPENVLRVPNDVDLMFQSITYGTGGESGYRKWRNGYLEQWGVTTSSANGESEFTLHQAYANTNFSVFIEPREKGNFFHYAVPSANQKVKTRVQTKDGDSIAVKIQWRSYGRWK